MSKLLSRKLFVAVASLVAVVLGPANTTPQQIAVAVIAAAYVLAQAFVDRATAGKVASVADVIKAGLEQGRAVSATVSTEATTTSETKP